ncbi:MAG TPA: DUF3379 family protein, partial [Xanthomonadales bacterium]|nr:DUF3379 family protein [Xanthomonadales bacterium]
MNCLEFRRTLAAEPASADPRFLVHRDACARCSEAHAAAQAFERTLERALQVPVPAGLADQVLLRQLTAARHERPRRRHTAWRLAAGFVLALGAGLFGYLGWQAGRPLPELAIAHLAHEPHALSSRADIPLARIETAFRKAGASLAGPPLRVDYLANCVVDGRQAVH